MAKWRRGGGRRRRWQWVIEVLPRQENGQRSTVNGQLSTEEPDPYTFDTPEAIRAALWRFEQRKLLTAADD